MSRERTPHVRGLGPARRTLVALIGSLAALSCGPQATEKESAGLTLAAGRGSNVIIAVFDTTRFDDWSVFATERDVATEREVTPTIDSIAHAGHRFNTAYSLYSVTVPSHVSILSGRAAEPFEVAGTLSTESDAEDPVTTSPDIYRRSSIFTILKAHGYRTYAFAGNPNVWPEQLTMLESVDRASTGPESEESDQRIKRILAGVGESWDEMRILGPGQRYTYKRNYELVGNDATHVNSQALAALREHAEVYSDVPYVLLLNYNDAHDPYFPTEPWDARFAGGGRSTFNGDLWMRNQRNKRMRISNLDLSMTSEGLDESDIARARALHLGELAFADHHFGLFLESLRNLGLMESTVIVCVSDHGETFGEGGRMAHGGEGDSEVMDALLHVPLVIRFPDSRPSAIDAEVDLRDIKPTLLEYLEIPDDTSEGRSLLPLLRGTVTTLPAPQPRPDELSALVGDNQIGGQDEATRERLEEKLKALGYLEPEAPARRSAE